MEWLKPRLQGFRRVNGAYQRIAAYPIRSEVLNLELRMDNNELRFYDPRAGERLPNADEETLARRAAEAARKAAALQLIAASDARLAAEARADSAEAELARRRAELEQLPGKSGDGV